MIATLCDICNEKITGHSGKKFCLETKNARFSLELDSIGKFRAEAHICKSCLYNEANNVQNKIWNKSS